MALLQHRPLHLLCLLATVLCSHVVLGNEQRALVMGGKNATPYKYNFYVQMERGCGAVLITGDLVMTAAHCLQTPSQSNTVHVGAYQSLIGMERNITAVGVHPEYNPKTMEYDLAILKLDSLVNNIAPVQMNVNQTHPVVGTELTVVGMGALSPTSERGYSMLQEANLFALAESDCAEPYGTLWQGSDNMLCAGHPFGGVDSCRGDSGGPLLDQNNVLVGIVSVGMTCGDKEFPGIYARVSNSMLWVRNQICLMTEYPPDYCPVRDNTITVVVDRPVSNSTASTHNTSSYLQDANGTQSALAGVNQTGVAIRLEIMYDEYAIENRWELTNTDLEEVIDKRNYYTILEAEVLNNTYANLEPGLYSFEVHDYARDGICCEFGNGYIRIFDLSNATAGEQLIWELPGNFTSDARVDFELVLGGRPAGNSFVVESPVGGDEGTSSTSEQVASGSLSFTLPTTLLGPPGP